jgi:quinol monooxygenase YgiN
MATKDTCCTIVPDFDVPADYMATSKAECVKFVELTRKEPGCLYYGFSFGFRR